MIECAFLPTRVCSSARDFKSVKINDIKGAAEQGKIGWIFLWLIGVPIPILLILFLLRGCT